MHECCRIEALFKYLLVTNINKDLRLLRVNLGSRLSDNKRILCLLNIRMTRISASGFQFLDLIIMFLFPNVIVSLETEVRKAHHSRIFKFPMK